MGNYLPWNMASYRPRGPLGCRAGQWEAAEPRPGCRCSNQLLLLSISYLSLGPSVGLWSFCSCRTGGLGRVMGRAYPGSSSLYH